jgi:hypothetical protein
MAKERIGKIQRWILIHTYQKTTYKKLPDDWKFPPKMEPHDLGAFFWSGLYRAEVLLNYFKLIPARKQPRWVWPRGIHEEPLRVNDMAMYFDNGYTSDIDRRDPEREKKLKKRGETEAMRCKAFVSFSRVKTNMRQKGLIEIEPCLGSNAERITLTKAGKAKAKEIIEREK